MMKLCKGKHAVRANSSHSELSPLASKLRLFNNIPNELKCNIYREEEAIKLDGLSVAQMKELRESAEKHQFQAEVNRMMNLIINSLYKNKEVCLIAGYQVGSSEELL